jgi:hypothetical protein
MYIDDIAGNMKFIFLADMRREKKEADRKRKTELMEAFAKYLSATPWLGPETHWRNAEDKIRQEFAEYQVLVEIGADCRTVFEKACDDKRREVLIECSR